MGHPFARYALRTTDATAAATFYDAVLGHRGDAIFPLHEQALARGARPHWLGHVDAPDAEAAATTLLARGAQRLGPGPGGTVVLREPGGALLALGGVTGPSTAGVAWHVLRTPDAEAAAAMYADLFGWSLRDAVDLGATGRFRLFAWGDGESPTGAIGGITPGVHPQWLFFFHVASVARAMEQVTAKGGAVASTNALPDGRSAAVCDDPQGAAFGLIDGP